MNEDLNVIVWILLIAALILSTFFTVISIYDYTIRANANEKILHNFIIDNCKPQTNYKEQAIELILNNTHIFHPQTCTWLLKQASYEGITVDSWFDSLVNSWK